MNKKPNEKLTPQDSTRTKPLKSSTTEQTDVQPETSKPVTRFRIEAHTKCYALAEVVVEGVDEKQAERTARQIFASAQFNVTAGTPSGASVVTHIMQQDVAIEILETISSNDAFESIPEKTAQRRVVTEEYDSAVSTVALPQHASDRCFLVILFDESADTGCGVVVRAEHAEAAERKALDKRKAEHDLRDVDDEAAGFKTIAIFGYDYLVQVVREMEMPEPEV